MECFQLAVASSLAGLARLVVVGVAASDQHIAADVVVAAAGDAFAVVAASTGES